MKPVRIFFFVGMLLLLVSCGGYETDLATREYILTTEFANGGFAYVGVGGEINGIQNPTLTAEPGETITVILVNGGHGKHDIYFPSLKAGTGTVSEQGESASVTFTVPDQEVELEYHDSVANHTELGMAGTLKVTKEVAFVVEASLGQAFQEGGCAACHTIPGVPGAVGQIGPDLTNIGVTAGERTTAEDYSGAADSAELYIRESLETPNAFVSPDCPTGPCQEGAMPLIAGILNEEEIQKVVSYLASLPDGAGQFAGELEAGAAVMGLCAKAPRVLL